MALPTLVSAREPSSQDQDDVRRFEDRFGWPSCPLPLLPSSQDQDDVRRFQDHFGWPSCPLLLPWSSSAYGVLWSCPVALQRQTFISWSSKIASLLLSVLLPLCCCYAIPSFPSFLTWNKPAPSFSILDTLRLVCLTIKMLQETSFLSGLLSDCQVLWGEQELLCNIIIS